MKCTGLIGQPSKHLTCTSIERPETFCKPGFEHGLRFVLADEGHEARQEDVGVFL